jgi:outer membrane lipoprotein LolB
MTRVSERLAALLLMELLLASCAVQPPRPTEAITATSWPEERAALQALSGFELRGRVALSSGTEGFNGGLRWDQDRNRAHVEIEGPLGAGGVRIDLTATSLTLTTSRGERLDGEAGRAELERRIGFALPLASLRYWLTGAPDPTLPADEVPGDEPRLDHLTQAGWHIDYTQYVAVDGLWLPKRLSMQREAARVRLIVERWGR